ncbi:hypothetical protein LX36DRAFT_690834 [Colletotrichum falcatum]|nr:hypothetical protein LX36DRAFT_690834 [Colletotrichum falcatum]
MAEGGQTPEACIRASIYAHCLVSGILKTIIYLTASEENYPEFCQAIEPKKKSALQLQGLALPCTARWYQGGGLNRWLVMAALRMIITCAFTAYTRATAPKFGSQPDCNASAFSVAFGVGIRATGDVFRYVNMAPMASIDADWVLSMVMFVLVAHCCCGGMRSGMTWARQAVRLFVQTGINVYMIVTLKQIEEWVFGQVLAIFVLLGIVVEVMNILFPS